MEPGIEDDREVFERGRTGLALECRVVEDGRTRKGRLEHVWA